MSEEGDSQDELGFVFCSGSAPTCTCIQIVLFVQVWFNVNSEELFSLESDLQNIQQSHFGSHFLGK